MHSVNPKKSLGQHFLHDGNIARKIVESLDAEVNDQVVEIGPGTGVLTKLLIEKYSNLMLIEIDSESVVFLKNELEGKNIEIVQQSILEWEPAEHLKEPAWFIGNLPYNISSPILFHLLDHRKWVKGGVFMVQKEVAERICAGHGNKDYGILSVLLGAFFETKYLFSVSEHVFFPKPRVKSAVFLIRPRKEMEGLDYNRLKKVVKAAFNQRRKTLRNALSSLEFNPFQQKEAWMSLRAEQLSVENFIQLSAALKTE